MKKVIELHGTTNLTSIKNIGIDPYHSAYSHLSNNRGGWNKRGGWDFLEKTST